MDDKDIVMIAALTLFLLGFVLSALANSHVLPVTFRMRHLSEWREEGNQKIMHLLILFSGWLVFQELSAHLQEAVLPIASIAVAFGAMLRLLFPEPPDLIRAR